MKKKIIFSRIDIALQQHQEIKEVEYKQTIEKDIQSLLEEDKIEDAEKRLLSL